MPSSTTAAPTEVTAAFRALAEPLRLQVLVLLQERELCVCELRDRLGIAQSKLSFHLKTLKAASLVHSRQQGRWVYYRLNPTQFAALEQYLGQFRRESATLPARPCED